MPKIPRPDIPRLPEHQDNATHFNSAPGLNWNVNPDDPGRALQHFGNRVLAMGLKAGDYLKEFAEERQKAEDTDAFQELELLTIQSNNDMNAFMRENPGRYEDFSREYQTRFEALEERRTEIKNRMSEQGKKAADFYIQKDRLNQTETVSRIERQAFVTAKTQNLETRLSQFAKMGQPVEDVQRMIDDYTVGEHPILTTEMADAYMAKYLEQFDFFRVRELIDAGDPSIVDQLKKKSDGSFTEYTHLTRDQREQLIRAAETQQNKAELEGDQEFLAALYQGEIPTEEMLVHAKNDGLISSEQFNKRIGWVKQFLSSADSEAKRADAAAKQVQKEFEANREAWFEASLHMNAPKYKDQGELDTAFKAGELNVDEYNKYSDMLARYNSGLERAKEQAAEAARKTAAQIETDMRDSFKWDIYTKNYPMQPEKAYAEAKKDWAAIQKKVKNPKLLLELSEFLNKKISDTLSNTEDEFKTPEGKDVLNFIEVSYWDDKESQYKGLVYDQGGWFSRDGANSQEHQRAQFYNLLEIARGKLQAGESAEKIKEYVKKQVGEMNRGKIRDVLNSAYTPQASRQTGHTPDMWNHLGVSF